MCASAVFVDLPSYLREQVTAAREVGFYSSEADLLADAVRTLLAARPDLRVAIACHLFQQGSISLGKGAELAGLDIVQFKRSLHEHGVTRVAPEPPSDIAKMANSALRAAGRPE